MGARLCQALGGAVVTDPWDQWQHAPIALALFDCSTTFARLRDLEASCGGDLRAYLSERCPLVLDLARSSVLLHANDACLRQAGVADQEALAAVIGAALEGESFLCFVEALAAIAADTESFQIAARLPSEAGALWWADVWLWRVGGPGDWSATMAALVDSSQREAAGEALRRREEEIEIVRQSALRFSGTQDMSTVDRALYEAVVSALPCDALVVCSWAPEAKRVRYQYANSGGEVVDVRSLPASFVDPRSRGVVARALLTGKPAVLETETDDAKAACVAPGPSLVSNRGGTGCPCVPVPKSQLAVPMNLRGEPAGAVQVVSYQPHAYGPDAVRLLSALAAQAAIAAESTRRWAEVAHEVEARRATEDRYRALLEGARDAVFIRELEADGSPGRLTDVNESACRLLGYSREELLALGPGVLSVPGSRRPRDAGQRLLESGSAMFEETLQTKDGRHITVELSANRVEVGRVPFIVALVRDISERVREREALQQATEQLRVVLEASPVAIVALDPAGIVQVWNRAAERMFGWSAEEAVGKEYPIAPGPYRAAYLKNLRAALSGEALSDAVIRRIRRDGTPIDLSASVVPVYDANGEVTMTVGVFLDVTEKRRLEEQLRQSQKMEVLGRLAGGIAHDFNNLLTAITGYGDFVQRALPPDGEAREDMDEILRAVERASQLTSQLLAFARHQVIEPRPLDLGALVLKMDRLLRRLIGEHIELVTVAAADLWHVRADPSSMEQVLINLAVNARDAMPNGGRLTIALENVDLAAEPTRFRVGLPAGEYVALSVRDTGVGMTADVLQHIFEPFYTTKEAGRGTGLGLATVYGIVKQHGGDIEVESEPGAGTVFRVLLPRSAESAQDGDREGMDETVPKGHGLVLVAEDEPMVRGVTCRMLRDAGYSVVEASTGAEALRLAAQWCQQLRLVVTDVVMPQMSGAELARRIVERSPGLPVLFVSGYADRAESLSLPGVAAPALLQKPFTAAALVGKVRELLEASERRQVGKASL